MVHSHLIELSYYGTVLTKEPLRYGPGNASLVSFVTQQDAFCNFRERRVWLLNTNAETFRTVGHVELFAERFFVY